jgi:hypothetical protein
MFFQRTHRPHIKMTDSQPKRCHVVKGPTVTSLVLLGDHLALDAKSLVIWLQDLLSILSAAVVADEKEAKETAGGVEQQMLPFIDWTTRIPSLQLPPFQGVDSAMLTLKSPEDKSNLPDVDRVVQVIPKEVFKNIKTRTKDMNATLNAPLMTAFFAAVCDCARSQNADLKLPLSVQSVCAVDVRSKLVPVLPNDYMNNSASIVSAFATFADGCNLWDVSLAAQGRVVQGIADGEAFRLQDITKRAAYAEMGPIFAIPCLWSNVGHIEAVGLEASEVLISGAGSNHIISGHCVEAGGNMALTISYAPAFHDVTTATFIAERFAHHIELQVDLGN